MSFISNIPHSIFNNILLMGVLWIIYLLIDRFFKLKSKHLFSIAAFFQLFAATAFLVDLFSSHSILYAGSEMINQYILLPNQDFLFDVGIIYFLGLFIYLIHFVFQLRQINILKRSGNFELQNQWENILANTKIEIPSNLKIGLSNKINSPMVFGYIEPIILLPIAICNQLSNEQIKLILIHEIAHIIRNDYLINLVAGVSKMIMWFNPFSYLLSNKLVLLRELACDDFVIEHTNATIIYSKALYQLGLHAHLKRSVFAIGAIGNEEHELITRIKNINKLSQNSVSYFKVTFSLFIFLMTALLGIVFIGQSSKQNNANKITANTILNQSISTKSNAIIEKKNNKAPLIIKKIKKSNSNIALKVNEQYTFNSELNSEKIKTEYDQLIKETRSWIKQRENPVQFVNYSNEIDSLDNIIAERLLISSIIKSYQLKRTIIAQKLAKAQDKNEAFDYIMNSKEWADIVEYEKWAEEYLGRHQQSIGLSSPTTKQQIQY